MRSAASIRSLFVGVLLGVAATLIVVEKTTVGERLVGMTPFSSDQAAKTYKDFDHGLPAQLHFQTIPNGVEADGLGTNDIENIGLIVYVTLRGPNGAVANRVQALVDTGSDRSFVSNSIIDGLRLRPALVDVSVKHGLLAPSPLNFYDLSVQFPGGRSSQSVLVAREMIFESRC